MFLFKELAVLSAVLISALLGLFEISNSYLSDSTRSNPQSTKIVEDNYAVQNQKLSEDYYYYVDLILNKSIIKEEIKSEINSLGSAFEKEYLNALLEKREGNFQEAFHLLYSALKYSPQAFDFYKQISNLAKITSNLNKLSEWISTSADKSVFFKQYLNGLVKREEGELDKSVEIFTNLVEEGYSSKELYYQLAYTLRTTGNYEDAFGYLIKAKNLCIKDDPYFAKIINLSGTLFFLSGDYEQAKTEYESALKLAKQKENTVEEIKSLANLAIIKDLYGELEEARKDFLYTINLANEIENVELLAFLYSELGVSYTYSNNLVEARKNYEQSYSLYKMMKNSERLSYLSANIGALFLQISNYKSALKFYNEGLNYAGENKLGKILNLTGIADVYSNESNYSKALEYYNKAKELSDSIKDIPSILKIDGGIGALYFNINRPLIALETLKSAEELASENQMPFEIVKLSSNIGTILNSIDSIGQAEYYFKKGIQIAEETGDLYNAILLKTELAHNYYLQQKFSEAAKLLAEAQKPARAYNLTQVLGTQDLYWGKIYLATNKVESAKNKFKNSFNLNSANDLNNQIESGYYLAKCFEKTGKTDEAEKWYNSTIDLIEKISFPLTVNQEIQIAHYSAHNDIYNSLIEFYLEQGKDQNAFLLLERSRARNTKQNLNKLKLISDLKDYDKLNNLIDIQWMINSGLYSKRETDSLNKIYSDIRSELVQKKIEVNTFLSADQKPDILQLQNELNNDEYFIMIYAGKDQLTLFNLSNSGLITKTLDIDEVTLKKMISEISPIYKSSMESEEIYINEDLFSFNALAAYNFYKAIFQDFLSSIAKNSTLVLSLPSEMVKLPAEMLVTEWGENESPFYYADKKFLLSDYQFVYSPSALIYFVQKNKQKGGVDKNLLVGNPYVDNSELTLSVRTGLIDLNSSSARSIRLFPLKFSEEEITSIDKTIDNNIVLLSSQATESNFKERAPNSNIVHISSHSFLIKDQPFVMFSPQQDDTEDGFLELGEIVQLGLNSEMVVLSSCRSGLGRVDEAEGIIGMQKAFFEAGSKSVVVTLWDVNDKYTSYFMKEFYKQLATGKSKAAALQETKLEFIRNHSSNPYYWSAFVLAGSPSAIELEQASSFSIIYVLIILLLLASLYFIIKRFFIAGK